jgi:hypothetical protein
MEFADGLLAAGDEVSVEETARDGPELEEATRGLLELAQNVLAELDVDVVLNRVL